MNERKISRILMTAAAVLAAVAIAICFSAGFLKPVMLSAPDEAEAVVVRMMEGVSRGDFPAVSSCLQGEPDLGENREPETTVGKLLWNAFLESFSYELQGPCHAGNSGVAVDLTVTYLDFNSVIPSLGDRAEVLLQRKVAKAEHPGEIYGEKNHYRQSVIDEVLAEAVRQGLKEEGKTATVDLTVLLAVEDGQWRVVPTTQLLRLLSGGSTGAAQ